MKLIKNFSLVFVSIALSLMMIEIILFFFILNQKMEAGEYKTKMGFILIKIVVNQNMSLLEKKEKFRLPTNSVNLTIG